jgi:hypothetical protein
VKGGCTAAVLEAYSACILMVKAQKQAVKTACLYNINPEDGGSIFLRKVSNTAHFHKTSRPKARTSRKTYSLQIRRN